MLNNWKRTIKEKEDGTFPGKGKMIPHEAE